MTNPSVEDFPYRTINGTELLGRLYRPNTTGPAPYVVDVHGGLGAVVAQGPTGQGVAAGEAVVVLVSAANRSIQAFGQGDTVRNGVADDDTGA